MEEGIVGASAARSAAFEVVRRVHERTAFAHETMAAVLGSAGLDARDTGFATRMAYGTIASRGTLEEAIQRFAGADRVVEPAVMDALSVSAYELLFASTPARAAVSQGVELVRAVQPKAAGFANAVLRRLAEAVPEFPWGDPETDAAALARLHGHPLWLAYLWIEELGRERAIEVMKADNEPAPLYLAHLPFVDAMETVMDELGREGGSPTECALPGCILAGSAASVVGSGPLARRSVLVADAAAQLTAALVPLPEDGTVIEIGAGRGTKALILAGRARLLGYKTRIVAVDLHEFKLKALGDIAAALSVGSIETLRADATSLDGDLGEFALTASAVLVDAPCSGLGTLRRHPDRRWRALPEEIDALAALGSQLLATAASLVAPGGFVVYSTCTVACRENMQVIEEFMSSAVGAAFEVDSVGAEVPEEWSAFVSENGTFQSLPALDGPDGHFIARLKRVQ